MKKICYFRLCSIVAFLCYVLIPLFVPFGNSFRANPTNLRWKRNIQDHPLLITLLIVIFIPAKFSRRFCWRNCYNIIWFALKAKRVKRQLILWYTFYSSNWFTARSRLTSPYIVLGNIIPTKRYEQNNWIFYMQLSKAQYARSIHLIQCRIIEFLFHSLFYLASVSC